MSLMQHKRHRDILGMHVQIDIEPIDIVGWISKFSVGVFDLLTDDAQRAPQPKNTTCACACISCTVTGALERS